MPSAKGAKENTESGQEGVRPISEKSLRHHTGKRLSQEKSEGAADAPVATDSRSLEEQSKMKKRRRHRSRSHGSEHAKRSARHRSPPRRHRHRHRSSSETDEDSVVDKTEPTKMKSRERDRDDFVPAKVKEKTHDDDDEASCSRRRPKRPYQEPEKYGTYERNKHDDKSWRWQHDQRSADDDRQSPDDDRKTRHYERSTSRGDYHQRSSQTERRISVEERKATRGSRKVSADLRQAHRDDRYSSSSDEGRSDGDKKRFSDHRNISDERKARRDDRRSDDHDRKSPDDQRRSSSDQRNPGGEKDTQNSTDKRERESDHLMVSQTDIKSPVVESRTDRNGSSSGQESPGDALGTRVDGRDGEIVHSSSPEADVRSLIEEAKTHNVDLSSSSGDQGIPLGERVTREGDHDSRSEHSSSPQADIRHLTEEGNTHHDDQKPVGHDQRSSSSEEGSPRNKPNTGSICQGGVLGLSRNPQTDRKNTPEETGTLHDDRPSLSGDQERRRNGPSESVDRRRSPAVEQTTTFDDRSSSSSDRKSSEGHQSDHADGRKNRGNDGKSFAPDHEKAENDRRNSVEETANREDGKISAANQRAPHNDRRSSSSDAGSPHDDRKTPDDHRRSPVDQQRLRHGDRTSSRDDRGSDDDYRRANVRRTYHDDRKIFRDERRTTRDNRKSRSPVDTRKAVHYDRRSPRSDDRHKSPAAERKTAREDRRSPRTNSTKLKNADNHRRSPEEDHRGFRNDRRSPRDDRRAARGGDREIPWDARRIARDERRGRRGDRRSSSDRNEFRRDAFDRRSGHEELNDSNKRVAANEGDHDTEEWLQKKRKQLDPLLTKAGGAYIPPAKLKIMQAAIGDKSSEQYQRLSWEHLKKRIHGNVNKVNVGNMVQTVQDLLQENIVRGKGLLARSLIQAQAFSPAFGHVYAALVAIINSKFPHIGELVLCRLIIQFKRAFRRNDKQLAITATKFVAHLVNQQVVHEVLALEILTVLLENPTDDSVEVAVAFIKECGAKLTELTPRGVNAIFERLRSILHESEIDKRVQYMIEVLFHIRKDKFSQHPPVISELDLVEEDDKITHTLMLEDAQDPQNILNVFRFDPDFEKNEEMYEEIKKEILGDDDEGGSGSEEEEDENDEESAEAQLILDNTETNLVAFRRTVYLTIQSSLDFQEAIHKLLKMEIKPGMEASRYKRITCVELCHMIIDCCAQQRTYEKFFGLMAERFCRLKKEYQENFEAIFKDTYDTIHRFEITKLRNTAKLFAHLFYTDAIGWTILSHIRLNEDDTTSASRIFIKILFQELAEFMGLEKLYERTQDPTLQEGFDGLFPRDNPRDTRFSINFFTSIGLGGLTVILREHLKSGPKQVVNLPQIPVASTGNPLDKLLSEPSSSSESSSSSSESEVEKSDKSDEEKRKSKRKGKKDKKDKKDKLDKKTKKVSSTHHRHHQEKKHKKKTKSKHKHK